MQDNTSKWKDYQDGAVLNASGGVQNLNVDLEKNIGDEIDAILNDLLGAHVVLVGLQVGTTTGLAVEVSAGTAFISGQRVRQSGTGTVTLLPASTTGIKIYVTPGSPFNLLNHGWPATFGSTVGALGTDQLLLATVATDGSGVTDIDDGRVFYSTLVNGPTVAEKAAMGGTGVTAPSGANKFVVNDDVRFQSLADLLMASAQFVTVDIAQIIAAVHTLNPAVAGPPFVLGVNAQNQKVIGLEADRLDGEEGAAFHNAALLTGTVPDGVLDETIARRNVTNIFLEPQMLAPLTVGPPLQIGLRGAGQLVAGLNADQVDGEDAAALHAAANLTGTLADARLSTNIPSRIIANTFTAPQTIAPTTVTPPLVLGINAQGQKVIGLDSDKLDGQEGAFYQNAGNLTGTLLDARLSANVPRRDVPGTFTGKPNFSGGAEVGSGNDVWHSGVDPKHRTKISHSVNQPILNDSSYQFLSFNAAEYNIGTLYAGNPWLTVQKTGGYLVSINVAFEANATGLFRGLRLLLNGTIPIAPYIQIDVPAVVAVLNGAMLHQFTVGDIIQVQVAHNATSVLNVLALARISPILSVHWVGP